MRPVIGPQAGQKMLNSQNLDWKEEATKPCLLRVDRGLISRQSLIQQDEFPVLKRDLSRIKVSRPA
eukprot:1156244-Pelagomonas_calceolata.AAC.1